MKSISEENGLNLLEENDLSIMSVGISSALSAEIKMCERNKNSHIIATTIDENGFLYAKDLIIKHGLEDRIELKLEDVSKKLVYEDNTFDYIYARLVLHYLDNDSLRNALSELYRVLKYNGKLFVVVRSINSWESKLKGSVYDEKTGITTHPNTRKNSNYDGYCSRRLHSKESIKQFLEESGFVLDYIKCYMEYLSFDFERKDFNDKPSEVIEVLSKKIR